MGRSLPQEWIDGTLHTLNVVRDLGGKGNIPHTSLSVVRQKPSANSRKTKNLQCASFLKKQMTLVRLLAKPIVGRASAFI